MVETIGGNAAARLFGFVQRIEHMDEESKAIGEDRKELYKEVRSEGFDAKTVKLVVKRRRMDPADRKEEDAILDLYERVVSEAETSSRTPATTPPVPPPSSELFEGTEWTDEQKKRIEAGGVAQGAEQRPVEPKVATAHHPQTGETVVLEVAEPNHDPETGEIIEDDGPKDDCGDEPKRADDGDNGAPPQGTPPEPADDDGDLLDDMPNFLRRDGGEEATA